MEFKEDDDVEVSSLRFAPDCSLVVLPCQAVVRQWLVVWVVLVMVLL